MFGKKSIVQIIGMSVFIIFQINSYGQVIRETKARIENIDFFLVDDKVKITYDVVNGKDWEIFDIRVRIYNAGDTTRIPAKTFSGDITAIKPGRGKVITWDIKNDLTYLDQNIFIQLDAIQTNPRLIPYTSKTKAMLLSTVYPGWGSSKTTLRKANLLKGAIAYTLIGLSFKYNADAVKSYDNYQDAVIAEDRDRYFDQSESNLTTSRYLAIGAVTVWAVEYAWILLAPNKTDGRAANNTSFHIDVNQSPEGVVPSLALTYNF